jgi:hypothetical protein
MNKASFLLLLAAAPAAFAGPMAGGSYEVRITLVGCASSGGAVTTKTDDGTMVLHSVGFATEGRILDSGDGTLVIPGLFGGAPGMINHTVPYTLNFGDSNAPSTLFVAANGLEQDYMVFTTSSPVDAPLRVSPLVIEEANENLAKSQAVYTHPLADRIWEIHFIHEDGSVRAPRAAIEGTLSLPYDDLNNDGVVDNTQPPVRASTLSLWWLDEDHDTWVRLPDSRVDASAKTVSTPVKYASVFAVMGSPDTSLAQAHAFPSPWRPNGPRAGNGAGGTGTSEGITFAGIPQEGVIRLYTLSGTLVRELPLDGTPERLWDGKNESGRDVATGLYIFVIQSDGAHKAGKVAVIR